MSDYPDGIKCQTPLGEVTLAITDGNHIYMSAEIVTVRGKEVRASLHVNDYGRGYEPSRDHSNPSVSWHAFYGTKVGQIGVHCTDAQRDAIIKAWVPAINEFMAKNPELRNQGQDAHVVSRLASLDHDIAELRKKIAEKEAEKVAVKAGKESGRVVLFQCCNAYGVSNPNHKCDGPRRDQDNS